MPYDRYPVEVSDAVIGRKKKKEREKKKEGKEKKERKEERKKKIEKKEEEGKKEEQRKSEVSSLVWRGKEKDWWRKGDGSGKETDRRQGETIVERRIK